MNTKARRLLVVGVLALFQFVVVCAVSQPLFTSAEIMRLRQAHEANPTTSSNAALESAKRRIGFQHLVQGSVISGILVIPTILLGINWARKV